MTNPSEIWQVEVGNQIFEANIADLCQWITEGALLPADRVRRGNLRWLEADKVPLLNQFFNAKECGLPYPVLQTVTDAASPENNSRIKTENYATSQIGNQTEIVKEAAKNYAENATLISSQNNNQLPNACVLHAEEEAKYVCDGCTNSFCKLCPKSYGASVKVCPMCGAMCKSIADAQAAKHQKFQQQRAVFEGFGFADFGNALAYPFKFKASLIFGATMFMFFTLGQSASALGGMFLFAASVFCFMLANTLTFGCLANVVENFSQGNLEADFMPRFDDFSLWDDVIHPFFLSLGTYLISFGLLAALLVGAFYYAMQSFDRIEAEKQKIVSTVLPAAQNDLNSQSPLESIAAKSPEAERDGFDQIAANLLRLSLIFSIPIFLAFLWGAFYFPAACAVAAYTRSLTAVLNPLVGLDTIKRLGWNYAKILAMCFVLGIFSMAVSFVLATVFAPLDLPRVGKLPAKIVGSFFTFYFSIVFAVTLGYALYKNSDRLNLNRG